MPRVPSPRPSAARSVSLSSPTPHGFLTTGENASLHGMRGNPTSGRPDGGKGLQGDMGFRRAILTATKPAPKKESARTSDIEVYLSEDILQGEEVPFYVKWKKTKVSAILVSIKGFERISRLYNVKGEQNLKPPISVKSESLSLAGYFGGSLTTAMSEEPLRPAALTLRITTSAGKTLEFDEPRTLHSARLAVEYVPAETNLGAGATPESSIVSITGPATVFLDITESKTSEVMLDLPEEIQSAYQKFATAVIEGMDRLKEEFPQHSTVIDRLLTVPEGKTMRQLFDSAVSEIEPLKGDKSFMEAFATVFVAAMIGQVSVKDTLFMPLLEYLESNAATKAYLRVPFLTARVPEGGGSLSCILEAYDLLGRKCGSAIEITTKVRSDKPASVPLKNLIRFKRAA